MVLLLRIAFLQISCNLSGQNWSHPRQSSQAMLSSSMFSADEALEAGAKVAVCSTSNEKAVQKIIDVMMDPKVGSQIRVFAGDIVSNKKPDPAIYYLAAQELGVEPSRYLSHMAVQPSSLHFTAELADCYALLVDGARYY